MEAAKKMGRDFIDFIKKSPTKYHAVHTVKELLSTSGFIPLRMDDIWSLQPNGKYYIEQDNSALIAFQLSGIDLEKNISKGIRLICAHTDSPGFKLKPNAELKNSGYVQLNVQGYAWPILSTWFDRPLSLAGRVALRSENIFQPIIRLVDMKKPLLLIPNAAFHLTKEKSSSSISKQKEMLPILGVVDKKEDIEGLLNHLIAECLDVPEKDILDHDLFLYPVEQGRLVGMNEDFIVTPTQDDLVMVFAAVHALINSLDENSWEGIKMVAFFDAEEETNSTLGGADSPFFKNVLVKLLKGNIDFMPELMRCSFAVSLDSALAVHPNYMECGDPTSYSIMNKGVVIKYDANMHYATTAYTSAVIQDLCHKTSIPYQKEAANSDMRVGGTLSKFLQSQLEIPCVDIGIPTWAVHSTFEACGTLDLYDLNRLLTCFLTI